MSSTPKGDSYKPGHTVSSRRFDVSDCLKHSKAKKYRKTAYTLVPGPFGMVIAKSRA